MTLGRIPTHSLSYLRGRRYEDAAGRLLATASITFDEKLKRVLCSGNHYSLEFQPIADQPIRSLIAAILSVEVVRDTHNNGPSLYAAGRTKPASHEQTEGREGVCGAGMQR